MTPKKRVATVSPKKGAKASQETAAEVMGDIESEEAVADQGERAPAAHSSSATSPLRKRRRQEPATNEAGEDADDGPPVLHEDNEMEEVIVTREDEDEEEALAAAAPTLIKEEEGVAAAAAEQLQPQPRVTPTAKVGVVAATIAAPAKEQTTPNRRVPRLKMDADVSEDVKAAHVVEDAVERDGVRSRERKSIRRPTSPARTRAFTSVASLTAVMKESKQRLKRKMVKKEEAGDAAADELEEHEEEEVDVENDGSTNPAAAAADSEVDTVCSACNARFPLRLEMIEHQMANHKNEFKHARDRGGLLMCAHPHCGLALTDMGHQLAHLAGYHNQTNFRVRQQLFTTEEAFMAWKTDSEQHAKSNYITRNEEVEIEPGVTELDLYCECSEDWRNADKERSMAPMLACPAHFTVRLDRNKDKVSIIGCTSHLGHLKKPNWSVYVSEEGTKKSSGAPLKQSKCHICHDWFRSRTALTLHRRNAHPDNIRTGTIACGDAGCDQVLDTMLALCEHVCEAHKRDDLVVEEYRFNSIADFEVWKERMEADTMSFFTKVSGRQRAAASGPNSECFFRYYQCHLSGYNQRPGAKKAQDDMNIDRLKIRNRGTKKMNRFCTAFMNIKINDTDGSVLLKGCLGHFGHECDIRRVPMPNSLRAEIIDLLQKGVTEDDVLAIIKGKASVHDRAYYLQKYEVKNIVKKLIKEGNGQVFYKYDDDADMGVEDEIAEWQEMKRPYQSTMYRSMINHPKRRAMGTYALQFSTQMPRKRRLVYRTEGDEHNPEGEEYYESVVEEMAGDMDEHVTYLDEAELDPSSSAHHHMMQRAHEHQEHSREAIDHHGMQEELEASTSSSHLIRRRKLPDGLGVPVQHQQLQHAGAGRTPLLKDGSIKPQMGRERQLEFTIHNIRTKIMDMTEQVKRCKDPVASAQMLAEVRNLEMRMSRILPQTGPGRFSPTPPFARRSEGRGGRGVRQEEAEQQEEYYEEEMVVETPYYELDDGRPGPSSIIVPRSVQRAYGGHPEVIYDVGSPGVEVDVEDLEEIEEGDVIDQIDV